MVIHATSFQHLFTTSQQSSQQSQPSRKRSCTFCTGNPPPSTCTDIKSPEERMKVVKAKKLCTICLSDGHSTTKDCQQMHHTSLHNERGSNQPKISTSHTGCLLAVGSSKALVTKDSSASDYETLPFVFLKTAIATVSSHAASSSANLLIHEGSQLTFITASQAK